MCCFDGAVKYSYFRSIVVGGSIRYYGPVIVQFIAGNYYYCYYIILLFYSFVVVLVVAVVAVAVEVAAASAAAVAVAAAARHVKFVRMSKLL